MPTPNPRVTIAALGVMLTMLLAACGSSSGSPTTPQPSRVDAAQKAQDKVLAMVLNDGDIPGFALHSDGREKLKDQLPKKGTPHYAVAKRLVTANWLASEHSIVIRSADGKAAVISEANLFKSTAAAARIWNSEASGARRRPCRSEIRLRDQRQAGRVRARVEARSSDRVRLPRRPPGRDVLTGRPQPHRRVHLDGRKGPGSPHRQRPSRRLGVLTSAPTRSSSRREAGVHSRLIDSAAAGFDHTFRVSGRWCLGVGAEAAALRPAWATKTPAEGVTDASCGSRLRRRDAASAARFWVRTPYAGRGGQTLILAEPSARLFAAGRVRSGVHGSEGAYFKRGVEPQRIRFIEAEGASGCQHFFHISPIGGSRHRRCASSHSQANTISRRR
jgi:hypothetical protein